jgi:hypothetical protein
VKSTQITQIEQIYADKEKNKLDKIQVINALTICVNLFNLRYLRAKKHFLNSLQRRRRRNILKI